MKFKHFFLIIFSFFIEIGFSQDIQQTFDYANDQYKKQEYLGAVEAFKRVLFFDEKGEFGPRSYEKIANSLYEIRRFDEATSYFDLAYFLEKNDSTRAELLFKKSSCYLLLKKYEYAQIELFNLPENLPQSLVPKKEFYFAMLYFAQNDFTESETHFLAAIDSNSTEKQEKIKELFKKNDKISKLNPKTARILSMIIPGMGQFYAGDIKNGLNSFLLEGTLGFLAYNSAINTSIWDALMTVMPWYQRYYTGGYNKAETIAQNQIKKRRNKVFNDLLDVVEQIR